MLLRHLSDKFQQIPGYSDFSGCLKQQKEQHYLILYSKITFFDAQVMFCFLGNVELVNRLLLDAGITSELIKNWRDNDFQYVKHQNCAYFPINVFM